MQRKPPWGMVFSVAAVIVALAVAGYAIQKALAGGKSLALPSIGPQVAIEWRSYSQYGKTAAGRVTNVSSAPLVVARVEYIRLETEYEHGLPVGVLEGRETNSFVADRETNILQPGESFAFSLMHQPFPLPSRVTVFGENNTRLRYTERLDP